MALCDYYLCDCCNSKTFYDASLNYDDEIKNPETFHPFPDGVGSMVVLCINCAKTRDIKIVEKDR